MPYNDLREYIERLGDEGELVRIKQEVDWNLEFGAICRRAIETRSPAPFAEKVKGYSKGRLLGCVVGPTKPNICGRYALALDLPKSTPTSELIEEFIRRISMPIKPARVKTGPVKENIHCGDEVNVLDLPVPLIHGIDGGRYIGTWHSVITKDPVTGWVNWGMYRMMVHDKKTTTCALFPIQHGGTMWLHKYAREGRSMPVAVAIGTEPVCGIVSCTDFPAGVDEVDMAGALRQKPVDLVKCETVDLEVPATAEIVIEGVVPPNERLPEGPFGEYTGFSTPGKHPYASIHVTCVTHRDNPILTVSNMGYPVDEGHIAWVMIGGSAMILRELRDQRRLPVKSVFLPPPGDTAFVSTETPYPGYTEELVNHVFTTNKGSRSIMWLVVVPEYVDPTDPWQVIWAIDTHCHPRRGVRIRDQAYTHSLIPYHSMEEKQLFSPRTLDGVGSRLVMDATFPGTWKEEYKPVLVDFNTAYPEDVKKKVLENWERYGYRATI